MGGVLHTLYLSEKKINGSVDEEIGDLHAKYLRRS